MVLNVRGNFSLFLYVFVGMTFHTKTQIEHTLTVRYCNRYFTTTTPKSTMISPVVTKKEGMKMTKQTKTKIVVWSVVKAKVGELEKITRKGRSRRMRKEVVGCVQSVVDKNKFLVPFEDGQKKEIVSCLLVYLNGKE